MAEKESVDVDPRALTDLANAGEHGLPAIQRLLELCQEALGAVGAGFVEFGPYSGRVIAASGSANWSVGRSVDLIGRPAAQILHTGGPAGATRVERSRSSCRTPTQSQSS